MDKANVAVDQTKSDKHLFVIAVLNMTWQMAAVVLVPIVGGYALDKKFDIVPLLTIVGFVMASFGVAIVLSQQLRQFGPPPKAAKNSQKEQAS